MIPVLPFEQLKVVTMTIITTLTVHDLNLPAIFALLPVTKRSFALGQHLQRKQGKIKFTPNMNVPGEILSMRYKGHVRGIVRSEVSRYFPHAIIIDIGTSVRIISVKLAKSIELTGPPSFEVARETVDYLLQLINETQKQLEIIQQNPEIALRVANRMLEIASISCGSGSFTNILLDQTLFSCPESEGMESKVQNILARWVHGYPLEQLSGFLNFILSMNTGLYTGNQAVGPFESDMINVSYELGFSINRVTMAEAMNIAPFASNFNNARSSRAVKVYYFYTKKDRTTGKPRSAHHTITINMSGYVTHSGPNFESMKMVYHSFMKLVLENLEKVQSTIPTPKKIKYTRNGRCLSQEEYNQILSQEEAFRNDLLQGRLPLVVADVPDSGAGEAPLLEPTYIITYTIPVTEIPPSIIFDYSPIVGRS